MSKLINQTSVGIGLDQAIVMVTVFFGSIVKEVARLGMEEARLQAELDSLKKAYFAAFRHARCLMAHDTYQLFVERMSEERTTPWPQGSVNEGTKS